VKRSAYNIPGISNDEDSEFLYAIQQESCWENIVSLTGWLQGTRRKGSLYSLYTTTVMIHRQMWPLLVVLRRLACFMRGVCRTDRGRTGRVAPTKESHRDSGRNESCLKMSPNEKNKGPYLCASPRFKEMSGKYQRYTDMRRCSLFIKKRCRVPLPL
jgi:hypothetical protein